MAPDIELLRRAGASGIDVPAEPGGLCKYRYCMMMDKDTVLPVGAGLRLCEVGGANQWKPGMSDAPGLGPGIISCQLQVELTLSLTLTLTLTLTLSLTLTTLTRWSACPT